MGCLCPNPSEDLRAGRRAWRAKTGRQTCSSHNLKEIKKDKDLLANRQIEDLEWHFFGNDEKGTFGPNTCLVDALRADTNPIKIVLHPPG